MKQKTKKYKLKRELSFLDLVLYGVGVILGAGIYALIGVGAGIAGNMLWLAFIIAAVIASFTGLSYAELSSMYPKEAAEYNYTKNAFRKETLSFLVSWVLIGVGLISSATVALGFGGYFHYISGFDVTLSAVFLIIVLSLLNFTGIKESARFNVVACITEVSGLVLIAIVGLVFMSGNNVNFLQAPPGGFMSIMSAVGLIFFAYIGFEEVANISEEAKEAKKIVPKALITALVISTVLYILVSIASVGMLGSEKLAASKAPLTAVMASAIPQASLLMSIIALFATANTVLILLIVTSRIMYGMSSHGSLPHLFSVIGKRGTPHFSVLIVMLASLGALLLGGIETIAKLTDFGIFIVYLFVNLALIKLRFTKPNLKRLFKSPSIGNFPVAAFLGAATCLVMLFFFELEIAIYELGFILIGIIVYGILNKKFK